MAIALSFPFCPSERKHPGCVPPGRPSTIGTVALAEIHVDHSICVSGTDDITPYKTAYENTAWAAGKNGVPDSCRCCRRCDASSKPCVGLRNPLRRSIGAALYNNIPAVRFNALLTLQMVETQASLPRYQGSRLGG